MPFKRLFILLLLFGFVLYLFILINLQSIYVIMLLLNFCFFKSFIYIIICLSYIHINNKHRILNYILQ